jgi:hypothetical protein
VRQIPPADAQKKRLRKALHIPPQFGDLLIFRAFPTLEKKGRKVANSSVPCDGGKCRASNASAAFACFAVMQACAEEIMWPWLSLFVIRSIGGVALSNEEAPEWGHKDRLQSAFWVSARFPILLNLGSEFTRISRNK